MGKLPPPPNAQIFDLKRLLFEKMDIFRKTRFYRTPLPQEKNTEFFYFTSSRIIPGYTLALL